MVAAALVAVLAALTSDHGNFAEEERIAAHLVSGQGFSNALSDLPGTFPTSWSPPVYPALIAAVYRFGGVATGLSRAILTSINVVGYLITVLFVFLLVRRATSLRSTAVVAAAIVVLHPQFPRQVSLIWDSVLALCLFVVLCWMSIGRNRDGGVMTLIIFGGLCGVLLLLKTSYLLAVPAMIALQAGRPLDRRWFVKVAVSSAAATVCLLPWIVRNYVVFERAIFVRGGAGVELMLGNLPGATGRTDVTFHPAEWPAEHALYVALGEPKYFDHCTERFWGNFRASPKDFWTRTGGRVWMLWRGVDSQRRLSGLRMALDGALFAVCLAGVFIACCDFRRHYRLVLFLGLGWLSVVPYTVTHVNYLYASPLRISMAAMAAVAITQLRWIERMERRFADVV